MKFYVSTLVQGHKLGRQTHQSASVENIETVMLKKIGRVLGLLFLAIVVVFIGFVGYAMFLLKKLPGQGPVFETIRPPDPGQLGPNAILVFSKTNSYRHASIEPGLVAIKAIGKQHGWPVVATENGAFFNDDYLRRFRVVVFLSTTGDVLLRDQEQAFERFIEAGGGYVGIHAASDTEYDWPWYDRLLGTHFRDHTLFPQTPEAELVTEVTDHEATAKLPARWKKMDEWYNFRANPRAVPGIRVLLSVDEKTYPVGMMKGMGGDHPISWTHEVGKGRMFYSALGHTDDTFQQPLAVAHLTGGIAWAGRLNQP